LAAMTCEGTLTSQPTAEGQKVHKNTGTILRTIGCAVLLAGLSGICFSQSDADINSEIEAMRADLRADKAAIITAAMKFTPAESSAFWPVYKKYEFDLSKVNDQRVALIKSYADKYTSMTDVDAKAMAEKAFDFESQRVDLKKKYFKEFNKQMPATTVARFFQLEHRLDLLMDLKLASELPPMLSKTGSGDTGQK
jgi:hypothetical protein